MVVFVKAILSVLTTVAVALSGLFVGNFKAPFSPKNEEDCKLNFAVISDTHIDESKARQQMLELGLYDMEHAKTPLDALVISGDITDSGNRAMYERTADAFSKYKPAENIIMAVGNHDTWNNDVDEEHEFEESKKLFVEYNKKIADREIEEFYYSTVVNGYTFIMLGADSTNTNTVMSDEQLSWLKVELDKASKSGLPIFVISHWTLKSTHGLPTTWLDNPLFEGKDGLEETDGTFSKNAEKVQELLNNYKNIFFFSGHLHNGFANGLKLTSYPYSSVETYGNIHSINLPCYMFANTKGLQIPGTGFQVEVYDENVLIRGRSYSSGVWYTLYEYNIELDK